MNAHRVSFAAMLATVCAVGATSPMAQPDQVSMLLARAREALGNGAPIDGVRNLVLKGSATEGAGHTLAHGEFEISSILPDKYVRIERRRKSSPPAGGSNLHPTFFTDLAVVGLNGPQPIYRVPLLTATMDLRSANHQEARAIRDRAHRECAQFMFGLLAASIDGAPMTFAADPNDAQALIANGAGTSFEVTFDPITHLPARFGDFEYGDYREVGGRRVPHLITRHIAGRLKHVWRVDEARFNGAIDPRVFRQDTWAR